MILSQTAEYAIRAVTALAFEPKDKNTSAVVISEASGIPLAYLSKILRLLVKNGILIAQKGPGGGFKFTRPLSKINFLDILTGINCGFDKDHCAFGWEVCSDKNPCLLHSSFSKLKRDYYIWASETTLAKVVSENKKL